MHDEVNSEILIAPDRNGYIKYTLMCLLLCSCSGSGGTEADAPLDRLEAMRTETSQLVAKFSPVAYTELTDVPPVGSASYRGFVSAQLSNTSDNVTDTLIGELSIDVNFAESDIVTGAAEGFLDENGLPLTGMLVLSNGTLDRAGDPNTDATFTFAGAGSLVDASGQTLNILANFEGDFLENNYSGVGGDFLGQIIVDGNAQSLGGLFIAESLN